MKICFKWGCKDKQGQQDKIKAEPNTDQNGSSLSVDRIISLISAPFIAENDQLDLCKLLFLKSPQMAYDLYINYIHRNFHHWFLQKAPLEYLRNSVEESQRSKIAEEIKAAKI